MTLSQVGIPSIEKVANGGRKCCWSAGDERNLTMYVCVCMYPRSVIADMKAAVGVLLGWPVAPHVYRQSEDAAEKSGLDGGAKRVEGRIEQGVLIVFGVAASAVAASALLERRPITRAQGVVE
jgi:hypothetical protein